MSKYTTEVRYICEQLSEESESKGYNDVEEIIAAARPKIFNFNYPIFDNAYKAVLETKILKHFYTREIGEETYGLWKLRLNTRMNEIMPYYNQMYRSELLEFNPFYDVDVTTTHTQEDNGEEEGSVTESRTGTVADDATETFTDTGTSSNTRVLAEDTASSGTDASTDWNFYNDTPQGGINGIEPEINQLNYLTNVTKDTHEGEFSNEGEKNQNETNNGRTTDNYTKTNDFDRTKNDSLTGSNTKTISNMQEFEQHVVGKRGFNSFSKMLLEFRETFLNIDMMVIEELNDLFLNLW